MWLEGERAFTKPPLLQESRLTGGGSPNLVVLVEWKVPVERFMGAANCLHWIHPWLYTWTEQTADPNCAAVRHFFRKINKLINDGCVCRAAPGISKGKKRKWVLTFTWDLSWSSNCHRVHRCVGLATWGGLSMILVDSQLPDKELHCSVDCTVHCTAVQCAVLFTALHTVAVLHSLEQ